MANRSVLITRRSPKATIPNTLHGHHAYDQMAASWTWVSVISVCACGKVKLVSDFSAFPSFLQLHFSVGETESLCGLVQSAGFYVGEVGVEFVES